MTLRVEALDESHDLSTFASGNVELDAWLQVHARPAAGQGTRTYVVVDDDNDNLVLGYFAIAPHLVDREQAPPKIARGAPRQIPSILLAKLALSERLQGQGLGRDLLIRALNAIVGAGRIAGGKLIVVDAIDDAAAAFYRHHDFVPVPSRPDRLVMKMSTAAKTLSVDWP